MTANVQVMATCPLCEGTGKECHIYRYQPQNRHDTNRYDIEQASVCHLCSGAGQVKQGVVENWRMTQEMPKCPVCKGQGGQYWWIWEEGQAGTRKQFLFEACSLCEGAQHVLPAVLAAHEIERRKLGLWGVSCAIVAVVGGLLLVTQVVSIFIYQTPWVQCCAPPHIIFVSSVILLIRGVRWML